ncbi:MAG TPA: DNA-3-methyladenine glycosylase I [Candidatus Saccharimonadales bacterium]|nr:DNA-3-methyladenine glycosylase I [Candidatus Saccharimonadales bacterium]
MQKIRCGWADADPLLTIYHDQEWGVPIHNDRQLFEMLNLEGAQAGLSWLTILKKRDNYRAAFDNFDAAKIASYDETKRAELLADAGIIRNKLKVNAFIENAKAFLQVAAEFGSFDTYVWQFVDNTPKIGDAGRAEANAVSKIMSKDLKKRGFRFIGPTTMLAFMQAVGMVNDHELACYRFNELADKL